MTAVPRKEPWDREVFLAAYLVVAVRRKGWAFRQEPDRMAYVEKDYKSGRHTSLAEYAEVRFELDQCCDDS